jgi:hypothetical protein
LALYIDARVPVVFGEVSDLLADDALVLDNDMAAPEGHSFVRLGAGESDAHAARCVCCVPRSAAGSALAGLFLARGRGDIAFFRRVLVVTKEPHAIEAALVDDLLAAGWFRVVGSN